MALFGGCMFWLLIIGFLLVVLFSGGGEPKRVIRLSRADLASIKGISNEEIRLYESFNEI